MTTYLDDLFRPEDLAEEIAQGYVRQRHHPKYDYVIFNYTEKAQFGRQWNNVTARCRGLIVDENTSEVLARPFEKFFNYGEAGAAEIDMWEPVEVTDKIDGSLGILYPTPDGYAVATRGSFESEQALHATEVYRQRYYDWAPPAGTTALFEIVYPENRIVVDYGDHDDLVLLDILSISSGLSCADRFNSSPTWPGPRAKTFEFGSFRDVLTSPPRPNAEGLVVRAALTDHRVKLKQVDYVELHKVVTGLNERVIWERMRSASSDAAIYAGIPDEFRDWVTEVADRLFAEWFDMDTQVETRLAGLAHLVEDRKAFAVEITDEPAWLKACLFLALDGKNYAGIIWANLKP
ncbi:RNA ligase [Saccharothrix sp. HUAS TT1]|uniref:RNA ligase n=1 Tax=unclassified Saccharothrix TaxID=2593673 RepID=UPI00345B8DD7